MEQTWTDFSPKAKEVSDSAFDKWLELNKDKYELIEEPEQEKAYNDMKLKIDARIRDKRTKRVLTIQYRFRDVSNKKWSMNGDVTMTEVNYNSGIKGEVFENTATHFLYGYTSEGTDTVEYILFEYQNVLDAYHAGKINADKRLNPKNQGFIGVPFRDVYRHSNTVTHWRDGNKIEVDNGVLTVSDGVVMKASKIREKSVDEMREKLNGMDISTFSDKNLNILMSFI